jgi:hypothetical protein
MLAVVTILEMLVAGEGDEPGAAVSGLASQGFDE